jgi:DNA-binding NarL/FixJ family response regulator
MIDANPPGSRAAPVTEVPAHAAAAPTRIQTFIVEDSPIILDNLIATLEEMAPVRVVGHAPDESSALHQLQQLVPQLDLLIIDIFLKSGSGLGVLRGSVGTGNLVKRVVLTNYATPDMREKCHALGADRVFDKSKDLDELIDYCASLGHPQEGG